MKATPCGGDQNFYYFYCGHCYGNNTYTTIAEFAKEHIANLKDAPIDEIVDQHIYWGSEYGFHSFYNGDSFILYDDIAKLPSDMRMDAEEARERNRREREKKNFQKLEIYA